MNLRPLAITAVLAVGLALAGCSSQAPMGGSGGQGGSGGTGGSGTGGRPGTSQDRDGGDAPVASDAAPVSGRLPAGWPTDVVAPEGNITQAMDLGGGHYLALIDVADSSAFAEVSASLQAAGYTVVSELAGSIGVYENAERQVQVMISSGSGAWNMTITITPKG